MGGFELGASALGWEVLSSCEINPFCRHLLKYYWPDAYHHDDIHTLNYQKLNEEISKTKGTLWRTNDIVLVGGFP